MAIEFDPFAATESVPTYSPTETESMSYFDSQDRPLLGDIFSTQPDYNINDWVVSDSFDRPMSSVEFPETPDSINPSSMFSPKNHSVFGTPSAQDFFKRSSAPTNTVSPFGTISPSTYATPLPTLTEFNYNTNNFFPTINGEFSREDDSPTPSLCGDSCQLEELEQSSNDASRRSSIKRQSPEDSQVEEAPKKVQRKRGRPRLDRSQTDPTSCSTTGTSPSSRSKPSRRLPHNQVERKYREGLNAELERLRRAIPTLPQRDSNDLTGPPKPSKATVLASAIDYIKSIEAERERLSKENERLLGMRGGIRPVTSRGMSVNKLRNYGWKSNRSNSTTSMSTMAN